MNHKIRSSFVCFAYLFFQSTSFAQTFKPHIGLNDRLMNSYVLCDRSIIAKDDAWYGEHDSEAFNREYDKMVICSRRANSVALNLVLNGKMNCKKAEAILFAEELTCQTESDDIASGAQDRSRLENCRLKIIRICEQFVTEKAIHPKTVPFNRKN